jgi:hypothetical protein
LASKVSSEDALGSIVSRFRPSGANAEAYKELMTLLVRDVCWLDDTSPPIDACTKFPFGSVKTSMFAATIGRIIGMSVHSQDPHNDPFVAYVCDLMKLEMLDGHRADFVDKIFFATLKNEYMLPVQSILLSSILYAAPEDERTALLSDPRIAQACPTHSLVERDMLNKVSVSEDVLLTKTSKRRLF